MMPWKVCIVNSLIAIVLIVMLAFALTSRWSAYELIMAIIAVGLFEWRSRLPRGVK
jgi:hypothetical protein